MVVVVEGGVGAPITVDPAALTVTAVVEADHSGAGDVSHTG